MISKFEPSLFLWYDQDKQLYGLIGVHVDDFLCTGSRKSLASLISKIENAFTVGKEESNNFHYVGLNIQCVNSNISVNQFLYIEGLNKVEINSSAKSSDMLHKRQKDILQSKIGQLLWVCNQTRPDVSFNASDLASKLNKATTKELQQCNKIISQLDTSYKLTYQKLKNHLKLYIFTDASFGNLEDGGSQGSYLIFLVDNENRCNILSWQSKRLCRIARSSLTAETLAINDGIDAAIQIQVLLKETFQSDIPIYVFTNNKSLHDSMNSNKYVQNKRLRIEMNAVKETVANKEIQKMIWINNDHQLADCLTKNGVNSKSLINVINHGVIKIKE